MQCHFSNRLATGRPWRRAGVIKLFAINWQWLEVDPGIDNLDKIAFGVGVLPHVLLLTPELAYREIYTAYEQSPAFEH